MSSRGLEARGLRLEARGFLGEDGVLRVLAGQGGLDEALDVNVRGGDEVAAALDGDLLGPAEALEGQPAALLGAATRHLEGGGPGRGNGRVWRIAHGSQGTRGRGRGSRGGGLKADATAPTGTVRRCGR